MAHRDLKAADRDGYEERFVYSTFSLFDQVQLSTTRRAVLVRGKDSILVAGKIDRRFDNDPDYPNQWRPLVRDSQANIQPRTAASLRPGRRICQDHPAGLSGGGGLHRVPPRLRGRLRLVRRGQHGQTKGPRDDPGKGPQLPPQAQRSHSEEGREEAVLSRL